MTEHRGLRADFTFLCHVSTLRDKSLEHTVGSRDNIAKLVSSLNDFRGPPVIELWDQAGFLRKALDSGSSYSEEG